jgi:hypothetical protein
LVSDLKGAVRSYRWAQRFGSGSRAVFAVRVLVLSLMAYQVVHEDDTWSRLEAKGYQRRALKHQAQWMSYLEKQLFGLVKLLKAQWEFAGKGKGLR